MGERIEFPSNGSHAHGYLAVPAGGSEGTVGVLVIQEWWGLVDQIIRTCDRFAEAGFTALAPDLYHGTAVPLTEPDEAAKQMMALEMGEAAKQLSGSVDELLRRTGGSSVGVVGFCMGGGLALVLATQRPDAVAAVVPAYGVIPWPDAQPDYSASWRPSSRATSPNSTAPSPPSRGRRAGGRARRPWARRPPSTVYPGVDHAFFNDDRPEVYDADAAGLLWDRTVAFLHDPTRLNGRRPSCRPRDSSRTT